ncbi:MAG: SulP family inorganic anion transporter [Chloroflexi bacterium]|nr:SulP family inorganic anion transporter [Chloroflexota bacterium]
MSGRVRAGIGRDAMAGLTVAITCVPQAIACGTLVGVSPVYGLSAAGVGAIAGGLLTASPLLVITVTNATALTAGQALAGIPAVDHDQALFALVCLTGLIQAAAGLLHGGRLTRFVSYAVMTGFLAGLSLIIILSQLGQLAGFDAHGSNKLTQTLDLLLNLRSIDLLSLAIGLLALVLAVCLPRTRLGATGMLLALAVPSALVWLLDWSSVQTISSNQAGAAVARLAPGLPSVASVSPDLVAAAVALALITLVQGAAVAEALPNPDGRPRSTSRDLLAQGVANLAAGLCQGLPVGGSTGQSALNVSAGGQTRLAAVLTGVWVAVIAIVLGPLVGRLAMPALAAILIVAGARSLPLHAAAAVLGADLASRVAMLVTFVATLVLPIQWAVGLGAVLSGLLTLVHGATDVTLVELCPQADGRFREQPAPVRLPDGAVTVLDIYGSLFSASAWTLERLLPEPGERSVLVLRLRGRTRLDATFWRVLGIYAERLAASGGRLYLAGVGAQMQAEPALAAAGAGSIVVEPATPVILESVSRAMEAGAAWLGAYTRESILR